MTTLLTPRSPKFVGIDSNDMPSPTNIPARAPILADIRFNMLGEVEVPDEVEYHSSPNVLPLDISSAPAVFKIAEIVSLPIDDNERPLSKQYNSYKNGRPISIRTSDVVPSSRSERTRTSYSMREDVAIDHIPKIEYIPSKELIDVDVLNMDSEGSRQMMSVSGHSRLSSPATYDPIDAQKLRLSSRVIYYPLIESVNRYQFPSVTDMKLVGYPTTGVRSTYDMTQIESFSNNYDNYDDYDNYDNYDDTDIVQYYDIPSSRRGSIVTKGGSPSSPDRSAQDGKILTRRSVPSYRSDRRYHTYTSDNSYRQTVEDSIEEPWYEMKANSSADNIVEILSTRDDLRNMLQLIMTEPVIDKHNGIERDIKQVDPISSMDIVKSTNDVSSITTHNDSVTPVRSILRPPRSSHADDIEYNYDTDVVIDIASQQDRYDIYESVLNILKR